MYLIDCSEAVNVAIDFIEKVFKDYKKREVIIKDTSFLEIIRRKPLKKRLNKYYLTLIRLEDKIFWVVEQNGKCFLERSKYK